MILATIISRVEQILTLLGERRFDLALTLTTHLEEDVVALGEGSDGAAQAIRDFLYASRLSTETLIKVRALRPQ